RPETWRLLRQLVASLLQAIMPEPTFACLRNRLAALYRHLQSLREKNACTNPWSRYVSAYGAAPGGRRCGYFLPWIARNPLKSPESDEGIQENPSPFSWFGLVRLWFGLERFGLRRGPRSPL